MEVKFEPGVVVYITHETKSWKRIVRPADKKYIKTQLEIFDKEFRDYEGKGHPSHDEAWIVRNATKEEIMWLELCEKEGKYMEKPIFEQEIY